MFGDQRFALTYQEKNFSGKSSQFKFCKLVKGGAVVSLDPTGSPLPLVQNNLYAKNSVTRKWLILNSCWIYFCDFNPHLATFVVQFSSVA